MWGEVTCSSSPAHSQQPQLPEPLSPLVFVCALNPRRLQAVFDTETGGDDRTGSGGGRASIVVITGPPSAFHFVTAEMSKVERCRKRLDLTHLMQSGVGFREHGAPAPLTEWQAHRGKVAATVLECRITSGECQNGTTDK